MQRESQQGFPGIEERMMNQRSPAEGKGKSYADYMDVLWDYECVLIDMRGLNPCNPCLIS